MNEIQITFSYIKLVYFVVILNNVIQMNTHMHTHKHTHTVEIGENNECIQRKSGKIHRVIFLRSLLSFRV